MYQTLMHIFSFILRIFTQSSDSFVGFRVFLCVPVFACTHAQVWAQSVVVYYRVIHLPRHRASLAAGHTSKQSQNDVVGRRRLK